MVTTPDDNQSLSPGFLVASPQLDGGPFERAVILVVHHDAEGAMGFIINRTIEMDFGSLLNNAEQELTGEIAERSFRQHVYFGGPVRVEQLWVIYHREHGEMPDEIAVDEIFAELEAESRLTVDDWIVNASGRVIEEFARGERDEPFQPLIGYAGWGPGQLEEEIEEGSWLVADFDDELMLGTEDEETWGKALGQLGLSPSTFMMMGRGGEA